MKTTTRFNSLAVVVVGMVIATAVVANQTPDETSTADESPKSQSRTVEVSLNKVDSVSSELDRTVLPIAAPPRGDSWYFFPGKRSWNTPFVGGDHEFTPKGARLLDARSYFFFYATGITPAMTKEMVGAGSQYAVAYLDSDGSPFDGSKTYKVHMPAPVPAKDFWSFTLYDNQTRSMLQTDQRFPGIDSKKKDLQKNADGSVDIYVGPKAPKGKESNWIQSAPGKGWNTLLRLYGPLKPWFDKTWIPGDFELVK